MGLTKVQNSHAASSNIKQKYVTASTKRGGRSDVSLRIILPRISPFKEYNIGCLFLDLTIMILLTSFCIFKTILMLISGEILRSILSGLFIIPYQVSPSKVVV